MRHKYLLVRDHFTDIDIANTAARIVFYSNSAETNSDGSNTIKSTAVSPNPTSFTGIVLTKLDGSAKGGIVFAIETELGIPVKLVGLGETSVDLIVFDPSEFVSALFE
jgi:signal recognition particle GTPase